MIQFTKYVSLCISIKGRTLCHEGYKYSYYQKAHSVSGNVIILHQRMKHERETSPSLLVQHLAFSDMMMGMYLLIIAAADQYYKVSL